MISELMTVRYPSFGQNDGSMVIPDDNWIVGLVKVRHLVSKLMNVDKVWFGRIRTEKTCFPVHNLIGYKNK